MREIIGMFYKNHPYRTCLLPFVILLMTTSGASTASRESTETDIAPCPATPNCVSSTDSRDDHYVAPFQLTSDGPAGWAAIRKAVSMLPRTLIVSESGYYIHAECRSRIFGFVDDLELALDESTGVVSVRSASRVGYSDLRVNRKRVERLRRSLVDLGVIRGQ